MKITKLLLITAVIFICTSNVKAQWNADTTNNYVVHDSPTLEEATPLQATDANGNTYISWFESSSGTYVLKMQLLNPSGNKLWGVDGMVISNLPQNTALYKYDLVVDNVNNAIVAFQDMRTGNLATVVYAINTAGVYLWGTNGVLLHDAMATTELAPRIGVLANNDVVIAWNASDASNNNWVAYQKITLGGVAVWANPLQIIASGVRNSLPVVLGTGINEFYICWSSASGTGFPPAYHPYINKFDVNGAPESTNLQVANLVVPFTSTSYIAKDGTGGCYVGFNSGGNANLQRVNSSLNNMFGTNGMVITTYPGATTALVSLNYRAADNYIYALMDAQNSGSMTNYGAMQSIDTNGTAMLSTSSNYFAYFGGTLHDPVGWANSGNGFITIYTEGTSPAVKIKAGKVDYQCTTLWDNIVLSSFVSNKSNFGVGLSYNHQVAVVWEDDRLGQGVYAMNVDSNGTIVTSVNNVSNQFLTFYPNPAQNTIKINLDKINKTEIYDVTGSIESITSNESVIDISKLSTGLYFIKVYTNKGVITQKLMKE